MAVMFLAYDFSRMYFTINLISFFNAKGTIHTADYYFHFFKYQFSVVFLFGNCFSRQVACTKILLVMWHLKWSQPGGLTG